MNDLISLISTEDYFSLACVAGECMHVTQVPGYVRPEPGTFFSPLIIGIMTAVGIGLVAGVLFCVSWLQAKAEQQQFEDFDYPAEGEDGSIRLTDDEREDRHRRAMMAGHVPCSVMFKDVSYVIKAKKGSSGSPASAVVSRIGGIGDSISRFFRRPSRTSGEEGGESAPLLTDNGDGYESEAPSEAGGGRRRKIHVLHKVHGYVKPGQVMAIMGGSGKSSLFY
jgi:ABC-type multidrug transport system fused ATPase/permease subunit